MRLPKDILNFGLYTKPNFYLCETDKAKICKLETTETKGSFKFNALSEISFEVARVYNDITTGETKVNPCFDKIESLRLVYVEGFGYFELQGPELISDGIKEAKSCTAYSLEYTLSQKYLEDFYINMGTVNSLEVLNAESEKEITPIVLYNPGNPKLSLLHLALDKIYGWKIGHVDPSLKTLSRQFEIDRESVYDFLMNEVCKKFNCYVVFDTINNTINLYAESLTAKFIGDGKANTFIITPPFAEVGTVSIDGYKTTQWTYNAATGSLVLNDVPESGVHIEVVDGALTAWETDVYISFDNLAQEVNINYDADAIKTVLSVTYGEDYDIREVNLGLPYLTDISYYYTVDWMGQDLYDAYTAYMQKSNSFQEEYINNSQEILTINDKIYYEEHRLSLEYSVASVSSSTVGTYYTRHENADGSYYYSEVSLPADYKVDTIYYSNATTNVNEEKVDNLYSALKNYFYACFIAAGNKEAALEELLGLESQFVFMETYTLAQLVNDLRKATTNSARDSAVRKFLDEMWVEIGRAPLSSLYLKKYKTIQENSIQAGWSNTNNENYGYYYPVVLFIASIETAIAIRTQIIDEYNKEKAVFEKANATISDNLLMTKNFSPQQLVRLSAFLREDELHLEDIVETSLDSLSSSFKIKQDAMESGRIELQKLCQPQLQFSMSMANIYALSEFEPIIGQFQLGKVIRVCLRPDYIKQSRLLQVDINFDDFSDFSCEFGELTSLRTQSDIHADLLSNAITAGKSVATNSSYWTRGSDQAAALDLKIQQGLLDATTQIKAIDGNQGVVIDRYGIKLQKKLPNGELDPKQTWLVNNMILMSDDGFKTSRSALGEITVDGETYYGLIAEMVLSGYIEGSMIEGGTIRIGKREDGTWSFEVDKDGNVSMCGGTVQFSTEKNSLAEMQDSIPTKTSQLENDSEYQNATGVVSIIDGTVNADYVNALEITVDSANINGKLTADQIDATNLKVQAANIEGELVIGNHLPSNLATTDDIPTNISDLNNDSNYQDETGVVSIINGTVNADYVNALSIKADSVDAENITGTTITGKSLIGGDLLIGDKSGSYAEITSEGVLNATGANITGKIIATEGEIGGCKIIDNNLQIKNANISEKITTDHIDAESLNIGVVSIINGTVNSEYVNALDITTNLANVTGTLTAANIDATNLRVDAANIDGTITANTIDATSGSIGGFTIGEQALSVYNSAASNVYLGTDRISIGGGKFAVESDGALSATSGTIGGCTINGRKLELKLGSDILFSAGYDSILGRNAVQIAGWNVDDNSFYNGSSFGASTCFICTGSTGESGKFDIGGSGSINGWMIKAGDHFGVTNTGAMYANSGYIGGSTGWVIDVNQLSCGNRYQFYMSKVDASSTRNNGICIISDITNSMANVAFEGAGGISLGAYSPGLTSASDLYYQQVLYGGKHTFRGKIGTTTYAGTTISTNGLWFSLWSDEIPVNKDKSGDAQNEWYKGSIEVQPAGVYLKGTWYGTSNSAINSARILKNDIESLNDSHSILFDNLIPRQFKYKDGEQGRVHYGLILDELKDAMDAAGLTSDECAAYCLEDPNVPDGAGGIRYSEFISLCINETQKLKLKVTELEAKIASLEGKLN